jgi:hypothetical protein
MPARDDRIPPTENRGFEDTQIQIEKLTCAKNRPFSIRAHDL